MGLKRVTRCIVLVLAGLSLATVAQASHPTRTWSLIGGGGQLHIGDGLQLPIQENAGVPTTTGTLFPGDASFTSMMGAGVNPRGLLVPVNTTGPSITGTVAKPLLTAMATVAGPVTKSGYQRKFTVPLAALRKPGGSQTTVGVLFSNPSVHAVGTNVTFSWPGAGAAVFSTGAAIGGAGVVAGGVAGSTLTYTNTLGARFGGSAQFKLTPPAGTTGLITEPVTVYLKINATTPACTHPTFAGTDAGCVAGIVKAAGVTASLGQGGTPGSTTTTPGGPVTPLNVAVLKLGLTPLGTVSLAALGANNTALPTNAATSDEGPWTTGRVVIAQPMALGAAETFTLTGKDERTSLGAGTISLVSGSLSTRVASGPNANRGWVRLVLGKKVPAASPRALAFGAGLMVLAAGFAVRRYSKS